MDTHTFVGRRRELEILERKLEEASTGRGNLVMLVGEAGIGKTWVAREFAERARRRGAVALSGCCFEGDWQPPYGPWAEAIREYVWLAEPERLRRELGLSASPLAQLVPQVRVVLPDTPVPPSLSPDDERVRLYDTVIHLLLAAAKEKPIVLVLDDLHWADRDSLQLLRHLGRVTGQGGLLIVGIYREPELGVNSQHPLTDVLAVLRREIDYQHMVVHGFSYEELAEYLGESLSQPLPEALAKDIYAETNGNPFYIREIARRLAEGKILRPAAHWSTGLSITELGIPQGVRLVVDRRISRLSDETKTLLKFAAAFTGGFRFAVLQAWSGFPRRRC